MDYKPGDTFDYETMRSTLLELSDEVFRTEVEAGPDAGGLLHRHSSALAGWARVRRS